MKKRKKATNKKQMQKITQKAWRRQLPETTSRARRCVINPLGGINLIEVAVDDENKYKDRLLA